ncbi:MAG: hypothetical protein D8M58_06770 [Calditrichaeota bacterium]|nr:MAG: hypothetical protein DWQ03_19730 [Calditrichota bacterium]MBL1205081.1 hypothetical protein [Calditrichota bacterium]NOG44911.1 hypothetical protein [Calditrichota bacterium]
MKKNILFSILIAALFFSCQPVLTYKIINQENNAHEYTINTRSPGVNISFFANYDWVGKDTVQTMINVHIVNGSKYEIEADRSKMLIISGTFDYKIKTQKPILIMPKSKRSFWIEYEAKYNPIILREARQMPGDEELILLPKGFKINGRPLPVEDISFVPFESIASKNNTKNELSTQY